MKQNNRCIYMIICTLVATIGLTGCNQAGSSSSGTGYSYSSDRHNMLGVLDDSNGATIFANIDNHTLSGNEWSHSNGLISMAFGKPGFSGTLTLVVKPQNSPLDNIIQYTRTNFIDEPINEQNPNSAVPKIELQKCHLTAGQACMYTVDTYMGTPKGNYDIVPIFTADGSSKQQELKAIPLIVIDGPNPTPGNFEFITATHGLIPDESTVATIMLPGSSGVFESIGVTINNENPNVVTVSQTSCVINSNMTCKVILTGKNVGTSVISLTPSNSTYKPIQVTFTVAKPKSYAYVFQYDPFGIKNDVLAMYKLNPNSGNLLFLGQIPLSIKGSSSGAMVADSMGHYLYVAIPSSPTILTYAIESDGLLTQLASQSITSENPPSKMIIGTNGNYLYASIPTKTGADILTYQINSNTGAITLIDRFATSANGDITIDPNGHYLYALDLSYRLVRMYAINANTGILEQLPSTAETGVRPSAIAIDPTNRYAYVTNYGFGGPDSSTFTIDMYKIESATGALSSHTSINTLMSPVNIVVDPTGSYVYVANYASDAISMYSIESNTGTLKSLGALSDMQSFKGGFISPWNIVIDPSGHYVYTAHSSILMTKITNTGTLDFLTPSLLDEVYSSTIVFATPGGNMTLQEQAH